MARAKLKEVSERPHVALIVETTLSPGRRILRGIARYAREHGPWAIYHEPSAVEEGAPTWLKRWRGDGIIARLQSRQLADAVRRTGLPVVDILGLNLAPDIPLVTVDNEAIAHLAAEHLLERGFKEFGCVGIRGVRWSRRRRDAFALAVEAAGCPCRVYHLPPHSRTYASWEREQDRLAQWVQDLPKPTGVLVCDDLRGQKVLEACRRVGVLVPEEMAVVGCDNDETVCAVCDPPLSSVDADHFNVGYEGAHLLEQLMRGESPPAEPIYRSPVGVVTRQSTDVLAIEDHDVATAVRFIHEHAFEDLQIEDVVSHVLVSQSGLQRRFRNSLGRSIYGEVMRVRIKRACELLAETDMPIGVVARKAGFRHQAYMGAVFKEKLGKTPGEYRRQSQG